MNDKDDDRLVDRAFMDALRERGLTTSMLEELLILKRTMADEIVVEMRRILSDAFNVEKTLRPMTELTMDTRYLNTLYQHGIYYVEELSTVSRDDVLSMRNVGPKTVGIIQSAAEKAGVTLRRETESRRKALEALYVSLARTPLRLILLTWELDWTSDDNRFTSANIVSLSDLLRYSPRQLRETEVRFFGNSAFSLDRVRDIEAALRKVGLSLQEE